MAAPATPGAWLRDQTLCAGCVFRVGVVAVASSQVADGTTVSGALRGLKRAYVVAAIGNVKALHPAVLAQLEAETESPILLLHSPLQVSHNHRLRGYYPLTAESSPQFCVSSGPKLAVYDKIL